VADAYNYFRCKSNTIKNNVLRFFGKNMLFVGKNIVKNPLLWQRDKNKILINQK
jgi:hypothetical protein